MATFTTQEIDTVTSDPFPLALDTFRVDCENAVAKLKATHGWTDTDARVFALHQLRNVSQSVLAMHIFTVAIFPQPSFWQVFFAAEAAPQELVDHRRELHMLTKFAALHGFLSVLESQLRKLILAIDPAACGGGTGPFEGIGQWILARAKTAAQYEEFLRLARLTRNTIHHNGVYSPTNRGGATVTWANKKYVFVVDKPIGFADLDFILMLAKSVLHLLVAIVSDPFVSSIRRISA